MMILYNRATWKNFVYSPSKKRFLAASKSIAGWVKSEFNAKVVYFDNKQDLDIFRKTVEKDLKDLNTGEAIDFIENNYPEFYI